MNLWKESADIHTADMLKRTVPEAKYITITTDPSEHQQAMVAELVDRAKVVRDRKIEPTVEICYASLATGASWHLTSA